MRVAFAKLAPTIGQVAIVGEIGAADGTTTLDFRERLASLGAVSELRINITSDGGDVFTGFAIYNMLNRHPAKKTVTVEGVAASMASVIAMVGDDVAMATGSQLMIHNPWGMIAGGAEQVASFGDALKAMQANIAQAYKDRTGLPLGEIHAMMNRETWLSAEEAVRLGFADRVGAALDTAAIYARRRAAGKRR